MKTKLELKVGVKPTIAFELIRLKKQDRFSTFMHLQENREEILNLEVRGIG
jgi:hypothetical protein